MKGVKRDHKVLMEACLLTRRVMNGIHYVSEFMPRDIANRIYEYCIKNDTRFFEYGNREQEFKVHTFHSIQETDPELLKIIQQYAYNVYQYVIDNFDGPFLEFKDTKTHIARFEPGKGMHEHFDSSRPNDIATLIYINDNYDGGEIYFPEHGVGFKPQPGDLLCFPDNPDFVHGVKPVQGSVRYTTPRWFTRIV